MFVLGDYVQDFNTGYRGRVIKKDFCFSSTGESQEWLDGQFFPVSKEDLNKNWYTVLVHDAGSILVPESRLSSIEPIDIVNPWYSFYFGQSKKGVGERWKVL